MPQALSRRAMIHALGLASLGSLSTACTKSVVTAPSPSPAPPGTPTIKQPSAASHAAFAEYAEQIRQFAVSSGDQAFGAIVVKDGLVVGLGPSRVVVYSDPTAHAEMEAIRDACRRLGTRDLRGCILYSTSHPCPMCEAAAYWAQIDKMMHGPDASDAGAPRLCSS
jgi:tRNA(Arg) A34 adenosine deaminase TadA